MKRMIRVFFAAEIKRVACEVTASALLLCADKYPAPAAANRAVQYLGPSWNGRPSASFWRLPKTGATSSDRTRRRRTSASCPRRTGEAHAGTGRDAAWPGAAHHALDGGAARRSRFGELARIRSRREVPVAASGTAKGGKVAHVIPLPKQALAYLRSIRVGEDGELKDVADDQPVFVGKQCSQLQNWPRAVKAINAPLGFPLGCRMRWAGHVRHWRARLASSRMFSARCSAMPSSDRRCWLVTTRADIRRSMATLYKSSPINSTPSRRASITSFRCGGRIERPFLETHCIDPELGAVNVTVLPPLIVRLCGPHGSGSGDGAWKLLVETLAAA